MLTEKLVCKTMKLLFVLINSKIFAKCLAFFNTKLFKLRWYDDSRCSALQRATNLMNSALSKFLCFQAFGCCWGHLLDLTVKHFQRIHFQKMKKKTETKVNCMTNAATNANHGWSCWMNLTKCRRRKKTRREKWKPSDIFALPAMQALCLLPALAKVIMKTARKSGKQEKTHCKVRKAQCHLNS